MSAGLIVMVPLVVPLSNMVPDVPPAVPRVIVEAKVGAVLKTRVPVPVSFVTEDSKLAEVMESASVPYSVPEFVVIVLPLNVVAVRAPSVVAPVTFNVPALVILVLTVNSEMFPVPVDMWLEERFVALNAVAPF